MTILAYFQMIQQNICYVYMCAVCIDKANIAEYYQLLNVSD